MKTIRKIKIILTTREFLAGGSAPEKTNAAADTPVCPLCHAPLTGPDALLAAGETEPAPSLPIIENKKLKDGENK